MKYPLLTQRSNIAPLGMADLEAFLSYRQDPDIARYQSWEPSYSRQQALELIESQAGVLIPEQGEWLQLGIHDLNTGQLLGDLALHSVCEKVYEIGFTIAKANQRQRYATEAATALIGLLFEELGAEKVIGHADRRNTASIGVLLRLGFEKLATKSWTEEFKGEIVTVDSFARVTSNRFSYNQ